MRTCSPSASASLRRKGNTDKDAKAFVRRLREKRVPDEIIFDVEVRVRTAATAGLSSPMLRAQKAQAMLGMMNLPGVNGRYWLEQYIANNFGSQAVTKGLLPEGAQSNPQQRRAALLENMAFGQRVQLPVDQADAHFGSTPRSTSNPWGASPGSSYRPSRYPRSKATPSSSALSTPASTWPC